MRSEEKKTNSREPSGQIITSYPRERFIIDLTCLPDEFIDKEKNKGYKYLFNLVDHFSKFGITYLIKDKKANTILSKLKLTFNCYGCPSEIGSDNGAEFKNLIVENFLKEMNIKFIHCIPYNPHSQGVVERFNQTLKDMLFSYYFEYENTNNLNESLDIVTKMYNNHVHTTTKYSPNEVFFQKMKLYLKRFKQISKIVLNILENISKVLILMN